MRFGDLWNYLCCPRNERRADFECACVTYLHCNVLWPAWPKSIGLWCSAHGIVCPDKPTCINCMDCKIQRDTFYEALPAFLMLMLGALADKLFKIIHFIVFCQQKMSSLAMVSKLEFMSLNQTMIKLIIWVKGSEILYTCAESLKSWNLTQNPDILKYYFKSCNPTTKSVYHCTTFVC